MIALMVASLLAAPVGACADRAACRFKTDDPTLKEALGLLELTVGELKPEPLKGPELAFALTLVRAGEQVTVKATSLRRPAAIWGEASVKVTAVPRPEWKQRALVAAVKAAIPRALEDLQQRISGVRRLILSLKVSGLDARGREHAERSLLPCLKSLYELTGPVTTPQLKAGYVDEAFEYLAEKNEPRAPLEWQVARVREAILGGQRSKCSIGGTPLQGWSTSISADVVNGAVVVGFKR